MNYNPKEIAKLILETLKISVGRRIGIAIGLSLVLIIKAIVNYFQNVIFFDLFTEIILALALVSLTTAVADVQEERKKIKKEKAKQAQKRSEAMQRHLLGNWTAFLHGNFDEEQDKLRDFIRGLPEDQIEILRQIYKDEHARAYLNDIDSNVVSLVYNKVIQKTNISRGKGINKEHVYIFVPRVIPVINRVF